MRYHGSLLFAGVTFLSVGCAPVTPYQLRIPTPDGPATPASTTLRAWDAGTAATWESASALCAHTRHAIAAEVGERRARQSRIQRWLLGVGSAAALATTIYSGIEEQPKKAWTVSLGAISGTTLLSSFQSVGEDPTIGQRLSLMTQISVQQAQAHAALAEFESSLFDLGRVTVEDPSDQQKAQMSAAEEEVRRSENSLLVAARAWANTCSTPAAAAG